VLGRALFTLSLAVLAWTAGASETPPDARIRLAAEQAKLRLLSRKIDVLKRDLAAMGERQTTLLGELQRLDLQIGVAKEELELSKLRLELGYRAMDENLKAVQALEASVRQLRPYLEKRAVSLYKLGELSYLRLLFSVEEPQEITRAYRYISRLAESDAAKMRRFQSVQKELEGKKAELLTRTREMLETRREMEKTSESLEGRRALKASILGEVDRRKEMAETLLTEVEESREALGRYVTQISTGEDVATESVAVPIRLFHGELPWPVPGRVRSHFGKHKHPRFQTVTVQTGIDIESEPGTPVRAVHDGKVVFASWFTGYGNVVIVSHPSKVHTIYGHLAEAKVQEGVTVARGDEIATVGDTGALSGPGLYFEVREGGKPVDPEEWLGRPPR